MARYRCSACMAEAEAKKMPKACGACNAKGTMKKIDPMTDSHCAGCPGCGFH